MVDEPDPKQEEAYREKVVEVQSFLVLAGYSVNGVDGTPGKGLRAALEAYLLELPDGVSNKAKLLKLLKDAKDTAKKLETKPTEKNKDRIKALNKGIVNLAHEHFKARLDSPSGDFYKQIESQAYSLAVARKAESHLNNLDKKSLNPDYKQRPEQVRAAYIFARMTDIRAEYSEKKYGNAYMTESLPGGGVEDYGKIGKLPRTRWNDVPDTIGYRGSVADAIRQSAKGEKPVQVKLQPLKNPEKIIKEHKAEAKTDNNNGSGVVYKSTGDSASSSGQGPADPFDAAGKMLGKIFEDAVHAIRNAPRKFNEPLKIDNPHMLRQAFQDLFKRTGASDKLSNNFNFKSSEAYDALKKLFKDHNAFIGVEEDGINLASQRIEAGDVVFFEIDDNGKKTYEVAVVTKINPPGSEYEVELLGGNARYHYNKADFLNAGTMKEAGIVGVGEIDRFLDMLGYVPPKDMKFNQNPPKKVQPRAGNMSQ